LAIRVTGGIHKGRRIGSPKGGPGIRPTTDRVKLAIFSIIGADAVQGKKVLDLFACTGALGIDAISRGAQSAYFVEKVQRNCNLIRDNLTRLGIGDLGMVEKSDCLKFLEREKEDFELVFLDPPFEEANWDKLMNSLGRERFIAQGGVVVAEHKASSVLEQSYGGINRFSEKRYGDSKVSFYEVVSG
tara:strand:- start:38 stop:598 length:561 start_codon:yes stop_codon:yes gene_type:complete